VCGTAFSLVTFWQLVVFLSFAASPINVDESFSVPCCGQFLRPLLWNLGLLALFILQHGLMASSVWKNCLGCIGATALGRMLYVLSSCATLHLIMCYWSALPEPLLWYFAADEHPLMWLTVRVVHVVLWTVIAIGILVTDPLELIGLKQFWNSPDTKEPVHRRLVPQRHVGLVALVIILWVSMQMSVDRFLISVVWTSYILLANGMKSSDYGVIRQLSMEIWNKDVKYC
jgi:hypothetical protein